MDTQAYIESGIIELYVLGLASEQEAAELERLRLQHAAIDAAILRFEESMELTAVQQAVPPPAFVKENFLRAIEAEESLRTAPVVAMQPEQETTPPRIGRPVWYRLSVAAIILLVVSAATNVYLYQQIAQKKAAYQALLNERNTMASANEVYRTSQQEWKSVFDMMEDPAMKMVKMKPMPGKPVKDATLFWDTRTKDVYVVSADMPAPPANKQFQLWAIVNGKPVDAGMIDGKCNVTCKMKNIPQAEAFAITLEKAGGNSQPDLSQLMVMAKV